MNKQVVIDGDITPKEPVMGENKSGHRTANGKSAKQLNYRFKRKYGEERFNEIMGTIEKEKSDSVD